MFIQRKGTRVVANDELMEDVVDDAADGEELDDEEVTIDPEASDLLFEAEDVAELLAEVSGEAVEVSVDDDKVEFAVGELVLVAEAEGDEEELVAATRRPLAGKRKVSATRKVAAAKKPVKASRTVRRVASKRSR